MACKTDKLTATVKAKVEPTPELIELLKKYRDGLNLAIRWAVEEARAKGRPPTLSKIHETLYEPLKAMGLPSVIAQTCCREALAVVKSYLASGARGKTPVVRKLHMWLRRCLPLQRRLPLRDRRIQDKNHGHREEVRGREVERIRIGLP